MTSRLDLLRRRPSWLVVAVLGLLAYVPALMSSPGRMPADTKLYLYLDPGRLIADAPWTFDGRQFAGWVPHQVIAYLWPQGPWFWLGETAGLADWVTHRLWIGTLLFAAGTGVLWGARRLGLALPAAAAAALVYQLSPYVLPYIARTSAILLPWAGVGWIVGLIVLAATRTRWRHAALLALVVLTVGAVNATALLMIVPAPALWLLVAALERRITWRRAAATAATVGGLSAGVSAWWVAMVAIQGRGGADVLAYSESLRSVSFTSTSPEVWRGMGYWLTYVRDPYAATTTAAGDHLVSGRVIVAAFLLVLAGLAGLVLVAWRNRRYTVALVVTGVVLAVGIHPIDDPSPLMDVLVGDATSGAALALRSSTRAVPVLLLGLALGAGALVEALATRVATRPAGRRVPVAWLAAVLVGVVALANLPSLTGRRLVDPALDRDQDAPAAWTAAAAALDALPAGYRVLQLPGQEFGAFRWGYTVDPPLPGLTDRPLVTRDLLPLGSPAAMDLLYALDDRFQSGTSEAPAVAPIARLLGVDEVWLTNDAAFERFRTPRPEIVHDLFAVDVDGVREPVAYGEPAVNVPDIPMVDEQALSDSRVAQPVPPVELAAIEDPVAVIRAKDRVVLVAGSGEGLVDLAAAGLIDGSELVRYTASLDPGELVDAALDAGGVVVTDTNRSRAHHWRSSQDVVGFTESGDGDDVLGIDEADERLPVFDHFDAAEATIAVHEGPVRARASGYGEPFAYRPEHRPVMAIDGDPATAWLVGDRADPVGQHLRLDVAEPVDELVLRQPGGAGQVRHVGAVTVRIDDGAPRRVELDARSFEGRGQRVDIEPTTGPASVTITVESVVVPDPTIGPALAAVGFAEVDFGLPPTLEVVRPPTAAVDALAAAGADVPVTTVLTRLRTRSTDRWRADPEEAIVRDVSLSADETVIPRVTMRLDQRAPDDVIADLLGIVGPTANRRLTGVATAGGWAAADGDPKTSWQTPFGQAVGSRLTIPGGLADGPLSILQPGGDHSPITGLRLRVGGAQVDLAVPPADADGRSVVALPDDLPAGDAELEITVIDERIVLDRRYAEPVVLPAAIAELTIPPASMPERVDTGCRDDVLTVAGRPVPLRVEAEAADLLAGDAVTATACAAGPLVLRAGPTRLTTSSGATTGLHVDRIVLAPVPTPPPGDASTAEPNATVTASERLSRDVTVTDCPDGCWLVLGEGYHESWSAHAGDVDLGPPQLVDGGFNGWWIEPTDGTVDVTVRWTAQRPLTLALAVSVLAILACLLLVAVDRRTVPVPGAPGARFDTLRRRDDLRTCVAAAGTWILGAVCFVGPAWGVAAAAGGLLVLLTRRPWLAGLVSLGIIAFVGAVITSVVRDERPFPDAGWPVRFEWLHGWGLFAAASLSAVALAGWSRRPPERAP